MNDRIRTLMEKGFEELTPDCFDEIMAEVSEAEPLSAVEKTEINKDAREGRNRKTLRRTWASLAAAAVLVLCVFTFRWYDLTKVTDEIYLDVNPSIALELNRKGDVVRAEGRNDDGDAVVAASQKSLKKIKDPGRAAVILVDEIKKENYLHDGSAHVLITWCSENDDKSALLGEVQEAVDEYAKDSGIKLVVYTQKISQTEDLKQSAAEAGMPEGRYVFYKAMAEEHDISLEDIKDKNLEEAASYIEDIEAERNAEEKTDAGNIESGAEASDQSAAESEEPSQNEDANASSEDTKQSSKKKATNKSTKKKSNAGESSGSDTGVDAEETASAAVSVTGISCTKKGDIQISFANTVYYGNSVTAILKDQSGQSVDTSVKKSAPQKLIISTSGLQQGTSYTLVIHGVKAQKKDKSDALTLDFTY